MNTLTSMPAAIPNIPWYRNPKVRGLLFQVIAVAVLIGVIYYLYSNTVYNMAQRGKFVSASFLDEIAPFGVGFDPIWAFNLGESNYLDVFIIAILNTMLVSITGIIAATLLGFLIGIMRLSPNWIIAKISAVYIELFRNIPLLLQIFFWYVAVFLPLLPQPRASHKLGEDIFVNKEGLFLPRPVIESELGFIAVIILLIALIVGIIFMMKWDTKRQAATGEKFPVFITSLGLILLYFIISIYVIDPFGKEVPVLGKFNVTGGINFYTSFMVMWFALSTYTAAFIAENVRGGIIAVSHGQSEASMALGVKRSVLLRLIVIPQALRVIIPPTISQFLNLTKNSSLAIAVAYEELSAIWMGISLNQTGQEFLIIASAMGVYLSFSLFTSAALNIYNKRVQIVER